MVHTNAIATIAALLALPVYVQAGLYSKSSPVLQIDAKNYDRLIAQSNYTSVCFHISPPQFEILTRSKQIVEFYAPWCGHCKNLQPAYEKVAKNLEGLAKVAAVDCDDEANKPLCGRFGVQGFPTLKILKPGKKPGQPITEDYNGQRTAKDIVDAVVDKIPNHVKRVEDKSLEAFLAEANDTAKAILFTASGKTSPLLRAVAIDFKGSVSIAQIRNTDKEKASVELFGISKFPTLVLLPGGKEAEGIVYDGELNKASIVKFITESTSITPNPDPAPPKVKVSKAKDKKKASKKTESASEKPAKEDGTATEENAEDEAKPSSEPTEEAQTHIETAPPIEVLFTEEDVVKRCLGPQTGTCILALLPQTAEAAAVTTIGSLSKIAHKARLQGRRLFPFYAVPQSNPAYEKVRSALGSKEQLDIIAINGRRGWWRSVPKAGERITREDVAEDQLEAWVDSIRLGEGGKQKLPEGFIPEEPVVEEVEEPVVEEAPEPIIVEETKVEETVAEDTHDEL